MFTKLAAWLDNRTGVPTLLRIFMLEGIPGGARWRYVWGSCLAFVFSIQFITGILLMTAYSPSSSQAWSSVHFIQYQMDFGWLIRGLHHFGSQTMMVLIGLHMLQVVIAGAHLPPREINWWLGMALFGVTFGLGLTGYLLPWDQKGYWATRVATNIAGTLPGFGPDIQQLLVGGEDYGNHTLTRFYALHVGILPLAGIVLIILHILIFRRHGVTSSANVEGLINKPSNEKAPGTEMFWPRQAFYDMMACMVVFGLMLAVIFYGHGHPVTVAPKEGDEAPSFYEHWAKAGQRGLGANLDAAADRQTSNYPARPEWYFLFLFQLLKYFEGDHVLIGTVIIPNVVVVILILLPLFGIGPLRKVGHYFGVLVIMTLFVMVGMLTVLALKDDEPEGILWGTVKHTDEKALEKAKAHHHSVLEAEAAARRACQMAMAGTPVDGGHALLRKDPFTRGQKLFQTTCGGCHNYSAIHEGPHGGLLADWAKDDLRFEVAIEEEKEEKEKNKTLAVVYVLAGNGKSAPKIDPAKITVVKLSIIKPKLEMELKHDAKRSGPAGIAFAEASAALDMNVEYKGTISGMVDGKPFTGEFPLTVRDPYKGWLGGKTASDLRGFGSKEWISELLKNPMDDRFFGLVKKRDDKEKHALTRMKAWRAGIDEKREKWKENKELDMLTTQESELDQISEWLTDHGRPKELDPKLPPEEKKEKAAKANQFAMNAQAAFFNKKLNRCGTCHMAEKMEIKDGKPEFTQDGGTEGPNLTGYGSTEWIRAMIMRPGHPSRYPDKNLMPAFRALEGPGSEVALDEFRESFKDSPAAKDQVIINLSDVDRELIIRFIRRDYRPVYGGTPIK